MDKSIMYREVTPCSGSLCWSLLPCKLVHIGFHHLSFLELYKLDSVTALESEILGQFLWFFFLPSHTRKAAAPATEVTEWN